MIIESKNLQNKYIQKKEEKCIVYSTIFPNSKREISKCFSPFSSKFLPSNPFNSREKSFRMRNGANKWNKGATEGSYCGYPLKRMALEFTCHLPRNMKQRVVENEVEMGRGWYNGDGRIKRERKREREHVVIQRRTYACPK